MEHHYSTLLHIPSSLSLPKAICLDAVGTLFGVRDSVGTIYSEVASKHGVECSAELLNKYFYTAFSNSTPCIFPGVPTADVPEQEYQWWREINRQTFTAVGAWEEFDDFELFFQEVYRYFATTGAWTIYPDTIPALENWQRSGVQLAVVSNFDSRLHNVLKVLGLEHYFSTVTISTEVSAAKPQAAIFAAALDKHACAPQSAWHIGDSLEEDYLGASNAGLTAIWLNRS
ncbi:HAD-IA family hydrolase [Chamaesiphon minutus]|uniref:Haloacid dehalogenase superfamily enzyme, subfamily IA,REG-2-like HAD hydrolase, subfamily IA n=1 Tax=Chamaesiphon minutus (strain ATCC 27169 / PCC 6605) TaxID=1173020 RepID=K9UJ56_CHAP6|nr:HAD-IA family hydrolase [Chamaesiphon minutus]AFY94234.1 haloacid dehalogenase superfamily enzyme, subfamily IA,REG-2-like HAD hydrolase, subfamily IA [Chamaesiphon minutus PCC 6605]